jgi:DNA polymerase III subunit chi
VTRIDFYILDRPAGEARLLYACRLAEKAVLQDYEVLINAASESESARLDALLWTFSQGSFLPHRLQGDGRSAEEGEQIVIGCGQEPVDGRPDLLINLSLGVPEFFSRFQRVAEVVGAEEENKAAGRQRFRYYRDRGYELQTHQV